MSPDARGKAKYTVRPRSLSESPGMVIDAQDARRRGAGASPRGAGRTGAAAEVNKRIGGGGRAWQGLNDPANDQIVKGTVEKGEGCSLAGASECRAPDQFPPPFNVGR